MGSLAEAGMGQSECGTVSAFFTGVLVEILMRPGLIVRTGQAHRTLLGHTGPVTCLQFDEIHIASGSLDKTLKVITPAFNAL